MNILKKLNNIFTYLKNPRRFTQIKIQKPEHFFSQNLYQTYDLELEELKLIVFDMMEPSKKFIKDITLYFPDEECIEAKVQLKSLFKPLSFNTTMRLTDLWHDNRTSTAVFELCEINIDLICNLPPKIQKWCGKRLISFISFWSTFLQKEVHEQKAHFYLQEQLLYVDFQPWMNNCLHTRQKEGCLPNNYPLSRLFGPGNASKGRRYLRNHIIFGADIKAPVEKIRLYLYRMPSAYYKNEEIEKDLAVYSSSFFGNWLEWIFAIATSFLLVSFLVPFSMAYIRLQPFDWQDLISIPSILLYNTVIVLFPLIIFRIVLIPMRRLWDSRQGRIEILQAEVARDQVFMPLLREWIIVLQTTEEMTIPANFSTKIREFLVKIGRQKYWLYKKISLIESRRRMYAKVILFSYLGVCLIEFLFLTGLLPTPQFFVDRINQLLEFIFLHKES